MQETKLADAAFPAMAFQALGYESAHHGEGRWNGVAILVRVGIDDVVAGFADGAEPDAEARLLWATCGGVRVASVYVPNGRRVDDDHYQYKLAWLAPAAGQPRRARATPTRPSRSAATSTSPPTTATCGTRPSSSAPPTSAQPEREALAALEDWGLVDVFRLRHPEPRPVLVVGLPGRQLPQAPGHAHRPRPGQPARWPIASSFAMIDRNARKGKLPSDHAPLLVDFAP